MLPRWHYAALQRHMLLQQQQQQGRRMANLRQSLHKGSPV
jgi:hypothetical protein